MQRPTSRSTRFRHRSSAWSNRPRRHCPASVTPCRPPPVPAAAPPPAPGAARRRSPRSATPASVRASATRRPPPGGGPSSRTRPDFAPAPPSSGPPSCSGGVLVRPDHGPVHDVHHPVEVTGGVGLPRDRRQHPVPDPGLRPPPEPGVPRLPGAVPLGEIPPGSAGPELPEAAVPKPPVVLAGPAGLPPRQERGEPRALLVAQYVSS